jgi:hypothetical protein
VTAEDFRGESFWLRADLMETAERIRRHGILLARVLGRLAALRQEISGAIGEDKQGGLF